MAKTKKKKRPAGKQQPIPDRPLLVLATGPRDAGYMGWYALHAVTTAYDEALFGRVGRLHCHYASELAVHDHPQNDPEAVELIRKAHE